MWNYSMTTPCQTAASFTATRSQYAAGNDCAYRYICKKDALAVSFFIISIILFNSIMLF